LGPPVAAQLADLGTTTARGADRDASACGPPSTPGGEWRPSSMRHRLGRPPRRSRSCVRLRVRRTPCTQSTGQRPGPNVTGLSARRNLPTSPEEGPAWARGDPGWILPRKEPGSAALPWS
jgi:hypothetical protein